MPSLPLRAWRTAPWVALALSGLGLVALPVLPFQDLPNHQQVLSIARLAAHEPVAGFVRQDTVAIGYSLYVWLTRALSALVSERLALALVVACAAVALPASLVFVAHRARLPGSSALWLTVPLVLCWPLKMGFAPYLLALPLLLLWFGLLLDEGRRRWLLAATCLTLSYLAHPLPLAMVAPLGLAAWLGVGGRSWRFAWRLAGTVAPPLACALFDASQRAFAQVAGTEATWEPSPLIFRHPAHALSQLVTRSWGVANAAQLAGLAPLLGGLLWWLFRKAGRPQPSTPAQATVGFAAALSLVVAMVTPHSYGLTWMWGDRLGVIGVGLGLVYVADAVTPNERRAWALPLATLLWLGATWSDVTRRAVELHERLTPASAPVLEGRYLTFRLSDPGVAPSRWTYGDYDSHRQVAALALSPRGSTPYLFAFARWLPVWFDAASYADGPRAPREWDANELRPAVTREEADAWDLRQIRKSLGYPTFRGTIVTGSVERTAQVRALATREGLAFTPLAPGLTVFAPR